jgi:hypothetical protein
MSWEREEKRSKGNCSMEERVQEDGALRKEWLWVEETEGGMKDLGRDEAREVG